MSVYPLCSNITDKTIVDNPFEFLSTDLVIHSISQTKAFQNRLFKRLLKESAIDCALFRKFNEFNKNEEIECTMFNGDISKRALENQGDVNVLYNPDYKKDTYIERNIHRNFAVYNFDPKKIVGKMENTYCNEQTPYCIYQVRNSGQQIIYDEKEYFAYKLYDAELWTKYNILSHNAYAFLKNEDDSEFTIINRPDAYVI